MPGQDKAMCLANTYLLHTYLNTHIHIHIHTHTPKHLFMHAHSNPPAPELANKQKKNPPYTHTLTITHIHARCIHCAGAHAQQGAVRETEKRKGKSRM